MVMKSLEPGGFGNQLATGGVQKRGLGNYDESSLDLAHPIFLTNPNESNDESNE